VGGVMRLSIKLTDTCPKNHRGEFIIKGANTCEILISKKLNQNVNEFAVTLLHELLHFWVTILQTHGVKEGIKREHRFINDVVPKVIKRFAHWYKEG
jgi:hypothetical protein